MLWPVFSENSEMSVSCRCSILNIMQKMALTLCIQSTELKAELSHGDALFMTVLRFNLLPVNFLIKLLLTVYFIIVAFKLLPWLRRDHMSAIFFYCPFCFLFTEEASPLSKLVFILAVCVCANIIESSLLFQSEPVEWSIQSAVQKSN